MSKDNGNAHPLQMNNSSPRSDLSADLPEGILLANKPAGITSFDVIRKLRKVTSQKKIGHAGTLDPFATGLLILLLGRKFTRLSDQFLLSDKMYTATIRLGADTDSGDLTGEILATSDIIPTLSELEEALLLFQGDVLQTPPMFSAKKVQGKKLYELARKGIEIERKPIQIRLKTTLISYQYPFVKIEVHASKGSYIRTIASDLGKHLGCFGHLVELCRTASGSFDLTKAVSLNDLTCDIVEKNLISSIQSSVQPA